MPGRVINGVKLPSFPSEAIQIQWVGQAGKATLNEAFQFYRLVKAAYPGGVEPSTRILDFGIGWGRIARFFLKDASELFGADIIAVCRDSSLPVDVVRIEPAGRLPHPDHSFDIVYAYSVFTHLPENIQDIWLAEIARVLKPGGLFVATVRTGNYLDRTGQPEHVRAEFSNRDRVFIPHEGIGDTYGDIVMTPDYVRRRWQRYFTIMDFRDDLAPYLQNTVIAKPALIAAAC